jgi:hypothetical protein
MGVDIHMGIASRDGKYIYDEIFDGRNSEWFGNISGDVRGMTGEVYQNFPRNSGIPDKAPEELVKVYNEERDTFYGFNYVKVADFLTWFSKARPDVDAGWVTTYDKWLYEKKGVEPEIKHYLSDEDNINDFHFIEVEDKWDCSKWLYDFLAEHGESINVEDYIVYYFDC